jgi:hypothetical protein
MQDLVISLSRNILKVSAINKNDFNSISCEVSPEMALDTRILNVTAFSEVLRNIIPQVTTSKNVALNFVTEPEDVLLRFVTIHKKYSSSDEDIIREILDKNTDINLENMYFSYEKIAPFVYQFEAVQKDYLERKIELSNIMGFPIKSSIPWVATLPKFVNTSNPSIFVFGDNTDHVVALSELGGIFFCGSYNEKDKDLDIQKVVKELSVYKRSKPINTIFVVNDAITQFDENYVVNKVDFGPRGEEKIKGFETNLLLHYILDQRNDLLTTQLNILNLFPVPAIEKQTLAVSTTSSVGALSSYKKMSLVKVGAGALSLVLLLSVGGLGIRAISHGKNSPKPVPPVESVNPETRVLSSENQVAETSPTPVPTLALKKTDLVIRIENGSGINGLAAKTKTSLESLGYKILEIDTSKENRDKTLLKFKSDKLKYKDLIIPDIKESYGDPVVEDSLPSTSPYDVLFIVGANVQL